MSRTSDKTVDNHDSQKNLVISNPALRVKLLTMTKQKIECVHFNPFDAVLLICLNIGDIQVPGTICDKMVRFM